MYNCAHVQNLRLSRRVLIEETESHVVIFFLFLLLNLGGSGSSSGGATCDCIEYYNDVRT